MFLFVIFTVILCVLSGFLLRRRIKRLSSPFVPSYSVLRVLWSARTLKELFKSLIDIGDYSNENGGFSKICAGPLVIYFVSSPDGASTVLNQCLEKSFVYDLIKPYVGSEVIAATGATWKKNRRILDLAFKHNVIDGYYGLFNKYSTRMVEEMATKINMEFDFTDIIARHILEVFSQTSMGLSLDGKNLVTDKYSTALFREFEILMNRGRYPWFILDVFFNMSSMKREQDELVKIIWELSYKMVKLKKEEHLKKLNSNEDFVTDNSTISALEIILRSTVTKNEEGLSNNQLRNIVDNLILGGFSSSTQLMFILLCVGSHPEVQERVYEEITQVIGNESRPITKDDLSKLTYLDAVVKETIRLYPIGPLVARSSDKDVQLETFKLPAGCQVVVHLWAINRNKAHWGPDADEFKPERWLNPDTVPSNPSAFASFSPGRRNCIGKSLGIMLMKIMACHVIQKFKIMSDLSKLELEFVILLKPVGGHTMKFELRNKTEL